MQNWNKNREKRGENLLFWRSRLYVDRDLQTKKGLHLVFQSVCLSVNQREARRFNSFSKSGPSCEKLAHPRSKTCRAGHIEWKILE